MSIIKQITSPWQSKPPISVQLDKKSQFSKCLTALWSFKAGAGKTAYDSSHFKNHASNSATTNRWLTANSMDPGKILFSHTNKIIGFNYDFTVDSAQTFSVSNSDIVYFDENKPFSISTWIWGEGSATSRAICSLKSTSTEPFEIFYSTDANFEPIAFGLSAGQEVRPSGITHSEIINKWTHIVATYNGNGISTASNYNIYIDGVKHSITTTAQGFAIRTNETNIGALGGNSNQWDGQISEIAVWKDRELKSAEAMLLFIDPYRLYNSSGSLVLASSTSTIDLDASDTLTFNQVSDLDIIFFLDSTDTLVFSESATLSILHDLSVTDSFVFSESADLEQIFNLDASDALVFSETATLDVESPNISATDTLTFNETATLNIIYELLATDALVFNESANLQSEFINVIELEGFASIKLTSKAKINFPPNTVFGGSRYGQII